MRKKDNQNLPVLHPLSPIPAWYCLLPPEQPATPQKVPTEIPQGGAVLTSLTSWFQPWLLNRYHRWPSS